MIEAKCHYIYEDHPLFKGLFEELTYQEGDFLFKFRTYEYQRDSMDSEEVIYLEAYFSNPSMV